MLLVHINLSLGSMRRRRRIRLRNLVERWIDEGWRGCWIDD
jgi:hypothetical protein